MAITNNTVPATASGIPSPSANLLEVVVSLAIVITVIFLLAWFIKRMGHINMSQNQVLQVKASLPLSTKEKLMIVQVGEEQIVIGVAPGFVGHIKTLETPLVSNDHSSGMKISKDSFSNTMNKILSGSLNGTNTKKEDLKNSPHKEEPKNA
jgi:flagellar protein FliO/FliZ